MYKKLDRSLQQIRLLSINSTLDNPDLECSLVITSLDDPERYYALSYRWSEDGCKRRITINGRPVLINRNLWYALRQILRHRTRHDVEHLYVWADQICIDQNNNEEKSFQVALMGAIYSKANMVWIDVGAPDEFSDVAMATIVEAHETEMTTPISLDADKVRAINRMIHRPYFGRAWIIQEMAKAKRRRLVCGRQIAQWIGLERIIEEAGGLLDADTQKHMSTLVWFRNKEVAGRKKPYERPLLLEAILHSRRCEATRPRDKIFALLSLARDGLKVVPPHLYNCPDRDIFMHVAKHIVVGKSLVAAILLARGRSNTTLPSWVPLWPFLKGDLPPWILRAVEKCCDDQPKIPIMHRRGSITLRGAVLDSLESGIQTIANSTHVTPSVLCNLIEAIISPKIRFRGHARRYNSKNCAKVLLVALNREGSQFKHLRRWLEESIDTLVGGVSLRDHIDKARPQRLVMFPKDGLLLKQLENRMSMMSRYRMKIAWTASGIARVVHNASQAGDEICWLQGCEIPVVLRKCKSDTRSYVFIGETLPSLRKSRTESNVGRMTVTIV